MALIAWYKLDSDGNDSSGSGYHGTPNSVSWVAGKISNAGSFSTSYILLNTSINLTSSQNWTVSAWVKTSSTAAQTVLSNSSGGPVWNMLSIENSKIAYRHYNGAWYTKFGTSNVADGNWHFLTWRNSANKIDLIVDGVIEADQVDSTSGTNPVNQIGKNWSTQYMVGLIDDLRIYNHALSAKEVKLLSQAKILHYGFESPYEEPTQNLHNDPLLINQYVENQVVSKSNWGVDGTLYARKNTSPFTPGGLMLEINITSGSGGGLYTDLSTSNKFTLVEGHTYTRSFWVKCSDNRTISGHVCSCNRSTDNYYIVGSDIVVSPEWKRYEQTFTVGIGYGGSYHTRHIIYNYIFSVWIANIQIEEKDHSTPFTVGTRTGIAYDSSGYENNGSIALATSPKWDTAKLGSGSFNFIPLRNDANYDENNGKIIDNTLVQLPYEQFTVSFWTYRTATGLQGGSYMRFGNYNAGLGFDTYDWVFNILGGAGAGVSLATISLSTTLNQWEHTVIVFDRSATNILKKYTNGVFIANGTQNLTYINNNNTPTGYPFRIGTSYAGGVARFYNGIIDDVRIYATALSADDILTLYSARASMDNLGNFYASYLSEDSNLTPNPGFEYDTIGTVTPTGWNAEVNTGVTVSTVDNRKCLTFAGDGVYRRIRSTRSFAVTAGDIIYGKLLLKQVSGSNFYFGLYYSDGTYSYFTSGATTLDSWIIRSGTLTIPAGVTSASIWIFNYTGNTGAMYVDNVYVSRYPIEDQSVYDMNTTYSIEKFKIENTGIVESLEFDEYNGIADIGVQDRIEKDGTLIINGEFSEVD